MSEHDQKKEVRRLHNLLLKMAELAEHVEQTGSFESGIHNSVKRYNAIVEHLEDLRAVPEDMFPRLEEHADFGQLGAEATLLADYLKDMVEEDTEKRSPSMRLPDIGGLVALAPFLGSRELNQLVRARFPKAKLAPEDEEDEEDEEEAPAASPQPDLKTIVALAPHMKAEDVGALVRICLARQKSIDPKQLAMLAPHMKAEEFGQLLRIYLPEWFGGQAPERTGDTPPAGEEKGWMG